MRLRAWTLLLLPLLLSGCGPKVDLTKGLEVVDVSTGWSDKGIVDGQNKLVPFIAFALKNVSTQSLVALDINTAFHQVGETADWDTEFVNISGSDGLAPGATSKRVTIESKQGYKGTETRAEMMKNTHFIDAKVDLFAKYSNTQWVRIGEFPVTRQLITK